MMLVKPEVLTRSWGTETVIALGPTYLGKLLVRYPGIREQLQYHRSKDETHHVLSGRLRVYTIDDTGQHATVEAVAGQTIRIFPGEVHSVEALETSTLVEFSTPHFDDRVGVESQYGVPPGACPATGNLPTTQVPTYRTGPTRP